MQHSHKNKARTRRALGEVGAPLSVDVGLRLALGGVLLTITGRLLRWFSACCSWKSSAVPNSGSGFGASFCLASCSSSFWRAASRALLRASSDFSSAPLRCLVRSASRMRSAAKTLPSAVSSSQMSGTTPLAWIDLPDGV